MTAPRGVKKVNEHIIQDGRTFIITKEDTSSYDWNKLPDGTLHINPVTGIISVKLENETTWVPAGIRNDGTICIAKDSRIGYETFTIKTVNNGDGTFTYINKNGDQRHKPITSEGYHVFELEEGSYMKRRNHIDVFVDNALLRNVDNGGIVELTETRVALTETLVENMKIALKYIKIFNIGHPYPRIFVDEAEPEDSEYGDFWLDIDGTLADNDLGEDIDGVSTTVSWSNIIGTPTTIAGYGIVEDVSFAGHRHIKNDITDFPASLPANGGNADTVGGLYPGTGANKVLKTNAAGKIPETVLPNHRHLTADITNFPTSLPANGGNANTVGGRSASSFADIIHNHVKSQITDFPTSLPANGGNADTVGGLLPGTGANKVLRTDATGKIPETALPNHNHTKNQILDFPTSLPANGGNANTLGGLSAEQIKSQITTNLNLTANIAILTGTISHGGVIPLPAGFTQAQCKWAVSVNNLRTAWSDRTFTTQCWANSDRTVHIWYAAEGTGSGAGTANYIIIGVK